MIKRTDLALELTRTKGHKTRSPRLKRSDVTVDAALSKKLNKPEGRYCTVESDAVTEGRRDNFAELKAELSEALCEITDDAFVRAGKPKGGKAEKDERPLTVLVIGLGNPHMTADSLGSQVAAKLMVTRHIESAKTKLCVITPNVLGVTGIESFDVTAGVVLRIKPDLVIAVDSLASAAVSRIASAFQVSSAGITPGSGVSNHRSRLNLESLGVPVVSMGVPLVVYASTIIDDALGRNAEYDEKIGRLLVTPKDIDLFVEDCAEIVAGAVNLAFFASEGV